MTNAYPISILSYLHALEYKSIKTEEETNSEVEGEAEKLIGEKNYENL